MLTSSGGMFHIDGLQSYYLKPGCLYITQNPTAISTVLGSCISVCFFANDFRCGGMNHYVYPVWKKGKERTTNYGDINLNECLVSFREFGYKASDIFARIIGGAWIKDNSTSRVIAEKNSEIAIDFCARQGFRVVSKDIGGNTGRKVLFRTDSGEASVEMIKETDDELYRISIDGGTDEKDQCIGD